MLVHGNATLINVVDNHFACPMMDVVAFRIVLNPSCAIAGRAPAATVLQPGVRAT